MTEVKLPDLGEGIEEAEVVSVLVSEGDEIQAEQSIAELETDKALVELPSPEAGRVTKIHIKSGDRIKVGQTILSLETDGKKEEKTEAKETEAKKEEPKETEEEEKPEEEQAPKKEAAEKKETEKEPEEEPAKVPATTETKEYVPSTEAERPVPAGPATRRLARELGVDIRQVKGSGPGGRITREDVRAYVRDLASGGARRPMAVAGAPSLPDFTEWGEVEREPLKGIRRKTAENVSVSWRQAPHVTQHDLADITEFEAARKSYKETAGEGDPKVTITALALKVCSIALKEFPRVNSSLDTEAGELILKRYCHIGVAVDTEHGLLVPVIRDVDQKSILQLAAELEDVSERARKRKLDLSEMRGGTFTITNLGGIGGTAFTPIVNFPEVAILGMSRGRAEPVVRENGRIETRVMLPLSLSYDHRVIDGADGARFLRRVASLLSDPYMLILKG